MTTGRVRDSVREGLVVVISILVAFWLDAWWDYRGALRQEDEIVDALEAEFASNRTRLERDIEDVRDYTAAAQRLLSAAKSGTAKVQEADSLGADLWRSLDLRGTFRNHRAYSGLKSPL